MTADAGGAIGRNNIFIGNTLHMSKTAERFRKDWVYHVLIWLLLVIPQGVGSVYILKTSTSLYIWNMLVKDGIVLLIIYVNFFYLIPYYYKNKKWLSYYTGLLLLLAIYLVQAYYWGTHMAEKLGYRDDFMLEFWFYIFDFARNIVISFLLY